MSKIDQSEKFIQDLETQITKLDESLSDLKNSLKELIKI